MNPACLLSLPHCLGFACYYTTSGEHLRCTKQHTLGTRQQVHSRRSCRGAGSLAGEDPLTGSIGCAWQHLVATVGNRVSSGASATLHEMCVEAALVLLTSLMAIWRLCAEARVCQLQNCTAVTDKRRWLQNIDTDQIIPAEYLTLVPSKV